MHKEINIQELGADDFARRFSLRVGNLMWLLGADGDRGGCGTGTGRELRRGFARLDAPDEWH